VADFADDAEAVEQMLRDTAIAKRKEPGPPACGACYYCSAGVSPGLRFCDNECRDEWEREARIRKQAPKLELGE
jgi:hypothetical protein